MDRINGADTVDIGGGRRGFLSENLSTGTAGTEVTDLWLNMVQEEILKVIEVAGFEANDAAWDLLAKAIQSQRMNYAQADGTANALTATLAPGPAEISEGFVVRIAIAVTNTGPATLNTNGLGARTIKTMMGSDLKAGDLPAGSIVTLTASDAAWLVTGIARSELQQASVGKAQVFTGSGNFVIPQGVTRVKVRVVGGGGGAAGGGGSNNFVGGGGAAGGYAEKFIDVVPGDTFLVTIGSGGGGGGALGGTGGTSSFGSEVSATGGGGGQGSTVSCAGGVGGVGTGGSLNTQGGDGGDGYPSANTIQGGAGGNTVFGGAGRTGVGGGLDGGAPGAGGGGAWGGTAGSGGDGANGIVIVEF